MQQPLFSSRARVLYLGMFLAALSPTAGDSKAAPAPPSPSPILVCQDAGAGGYEAFPDVCRLQDGRLMTVFYAEEGEGSSIRAKRFRATRSGIEFQP